VVVAAGSFAGVYLLLDDDGGGTRQPAGTTTTTAPAGGDTTTVPADDGAVLGGPAEPANIAVLESLDQADATEADAVARAESFTGAGARVLDSTAYETDSRDEPLTDGLWVVWAGPFATFAEAEAFCATPAAGDGCFALHVFPLGA
jgi:hypothetical protein